MRVLTALPLVLAALPVWAQDIGGTYTVQGTNLDGSAYSGEATITQTSEYTCEIAWTTGDSTSTGICMRDSNAFTAAYELSGQIGLVIYLVKPDGVLDGTWTVAGINAVGTEILTPKK
mgnify:CR=1 FL=1